MKDKKDTVWYAIKQGLLIIFIIIMIFLSFGAILLAIVFIGLDDKDEESNIEYFDTVGYSWEY